jgi:hypothetical protein
MSEHIRPEYLALAARPEQITLAEWHTMRLNSWELELLIPRLDNEALTYVARLYAKNCTPSQRPCTVYDAAVVHVLLPELLRRLPL